MKGLCDAGRIGVVANPCAGSGPGALRAALDRLFQRLRGQDVVLNDGTLEAEAADANGVRCARAHGEPGDARRLADALLDASVDAIVGVGGDGTLGDIGGALVERESKAVLLGIGVGSSNVGPLVAVSAADIDALFDGRWSLRAVHALDVRVDGKKVGTAFHDVTPATTYFGTRAGRRVDLDAAAALRGEDRAAALRSVCTSATWLAKNGRRLVPGDAAAGAVVAGGQVVASPLNDVDECRGKAVAGFLCWGPYVGCRGVLAVASTLLIRTRLSLDDLLAAEPLRLLHVGIAPGDVVDIGGLEDGAVAVIDGTPRIAMGSESFLSLGAIENAVTVARRAGAHGVEGAA